MLVYLYVTICAGSCPSAKFMNRLILTYFINSGYLEFWHAILIDLGSLVVVIANGTRILGSGAFSGIKA